MTESQHDTAGVIAPPPLIFLGVLALGFILSAIFPIPFLTDAPTWIIAVALIFCAAFVAISALAAMRRAGTSPDPSEPTRALVTDGPFHFTRNPIYVSFALAYLGIALG